MTTDKDKLATRIYLRSVLPLTKVMLADDPKIAAMFRGVSATVQFVAQSDDGPVGAHLVFDNGALAVIQGLAEKPTLTLGFSSLAAMNKLFGGKLAVPGIKGWTNVGLLIKSMRLLLALKLLMPNVNPKDPKKRELKVKMLLFMVANALSQLNKGGDPDMKKYTEKMPDRIFQWSIEPLGIAAYLRVKAGKTKSGRGFYGRKLPVVHMRFQGVEGAYGVLTSQADLVPAVINGLVIIDGSPEYGKNIGVYMKRIEGLIT